MPPRIPAALVAASLFIAGCAGGEPRSPVYPVSGTVQMDGKPLAKAMIVFHPVNPVAGARPDDPASSSRVAEADDAGRYSLSTYDGDDGAPAGDYVVTVQPVGGPTIEEGGGPSGATRPPRDLAKFAKKETSPLKAAVKPGDNPPIDFDLK